MIIAVDHGNYSVKTVNCEPIKAGLVESEIRPFGDNVLKYKHKYYQLSEQRIPYRRDKTEDDRYFVLTLFAIAQEIDAMKVYFSGVIPIQLAVGLPPAHFGTQNRAFTQYFKYRQYAISITDVACYPQSYAAAMTMYCDMVKVPRALILDIGGYTVDYLQIRNGTGDMTVCDSLENGIITLYNKITSRARSEHDILLSEGEIDMILTGNRTDLPAQVVELTEHMAQEFISDLLSGLRERQLELKSGMTVF